MDNDEKLDFKCAWCGDKSSSLDKDEDVKTYTDFTLVPYKCDGCGRRSWLMDY